MNFKILSRINKYEFLNYVYDNNNNIADFENIFNAKVGALKQCISGDQAIIVVDINTTKTMFKIVKIL